LALARVVALPGLCEGAVGALQTKRGQLCSSHSSSTLSTHPFLPSLAVVEKHPVVDTVLRLAAVLEDLGEELA
jgi:hypothetical protein